MQIPLQVALSFTLPCLVLSLHLIFHSSDLLTLKTQLSFSLPEKNIYSKGRHKNHFLFQNSLDSKDVNEMFLVFIPLWNQLLLRISMQRLTFRNVTISEAYHTICFREVKGGKKAHKGRVHLKIMHDQIGVCVKKCAQTCFTERHWFPYWNGKVFLQSGTEQAYNKNVDRTQRDQTKIRLTGFHMPAGEMQCYCNKASTIHPWVIHKLWIDSLCCLDWFFGFTKIRLYCSNKCFSHSQHHLVIRTKIYYLFILSVYRLPSQAI